MKSDCEVPPNDLLYVKRDAILTEADRLSNITHKVTIYTMYKKSPVGTYA